MMMQKSPRDGATNKQYNLWWMSLDSLPHADVGEQGIEKKGKEKEHQQGA